MRFFEFLVVFFIFSGLAIVMSDWDEKPSTGLGVTAAIFLFLAIICILLGV